MNNEAVLVIPAVDCREILPIDLQQRSRVVSQTHRYIELAGDLFNKNFPIIPVGFNLSGYSAGVYRRCGKQREIRFNPYIFAKYFEDNITSTVPHEVAHYVVDLMAGMSKVRPHGLEWRRVMSAFGCEANRTCRFDMSDIPVRRQRRYAYKCRCSIHQVSARRHNNICRHKQRYTCKKCNGDISLSPAE